MSNELLKEIRGCMTRFEALTPELLQSMSCDGLTYEELSAHMKQAGLSIEKVVCDPARRLQNAFYADYENGRYCEIYLQRSYLDILLKIAMMNFSENSGSRLLAKKDWRGFYSHDVPVPMQIFDFQKRYRDINTDEVFHVWLSIHIRIDYANGLWRDDVLEYVFSYAPAPELPQTETDGRITVYRGMGELSQPPEKAISWTTNPINALWFANRSGRGTKLLVARVWPEQVVAYLPTFRNENEIIVKPGSITEFFAEDMIPATQDYVPAMLMPATADFMRYSSAAKKLGYPIESPFQYHGLKHIFRVLLLSLLYFYNSGEELTETDKGILIYFSLFHDIGRDSEGEDESHGDKSVQWLRNKAIWLGGIYLSRKEYRMAELLIAYHCRDDETGIQAIQSISGFSDADKKRACRLYAIAKDMDGLDRVRFNGLDYRMLRTKYGRRLPLIAGCLLEEPLLEKLCTSGWGESVSALTNRKGEEIHEG